MDPALAEKAILKQSSRNAMADSLTEEISLFTEENCEAEILEETREIR